MKTIIILLNFLFISLILYSFLNSKIVEYFSDCPASRTNEVTKQSSQLDRNQSELNKLSAKYKELQNIATIQNNLINANGQNAKNVVKDIEKEKEEKMAELDKLDKKFKGGGSSIASGGKSLNKFGKIMASSPSIST
jgi:F0F1-type ATP synthase membrane subunit b/b'